MAGLANTTMPGCTYEVKHASWDATRRTAAFFAVFKGQHTGPGPCPPTGKSTASDYVYVMHVDAAGKIDSMTKVRMADGRVRPAAWMRCAFVHPVRPSIRIQGS